MADLTPAEPLGLPEVKLNLRVEGADEDALIEELITTARVYVETSTELVLVRRTVTETVDALGRWIDLVSWPVSGVSEIRYPLANVMTPLPGSAWVASFKRRPVRILPVALGWGVGMAACGAAALPVEIDVVAGYATADDVPRLLRQAMHLLIAHFYSNRAAAEVGARAAAVEIPFGVNELLRPYRLMRV